MHELSSHQISEVSGGYLVTDVLIGTGVGGVIGFGIATILTLGCCTDTYGGSFIIFPSTTELAQFGGVVIGGAMGLAASLTNYYNQNY